MKERVLAFDYFRGIAILLVVAGHSIYFTGEVSDSSFFNKTIINLIQGATGLFVFISGFFFLGWLSHYEEKPIPLLKSLAHMSFGIFFIHGVILMLLNQLGVYSYFGFGGILFSIINLLFILIVSVITIKITKKIFASYSKYLIGF